ncbi:hypothetical protein E1B28_003342 [Marasmius oreades]|uniref:Uncharacterized protein n=1 Tax=Marasmius oreades TaxID=181124 RepID=A0A9P7UJQ1_9AGAR|nr:uncharacterized protein E1B28_003342 [Marasmius oreades]KAG7085802.1 hypothetical protein E1B28_003342 [Marasmius oreades]
MNILKEKHSERNERDQEETALILGVPRRHASSDLRRFLVFPLFNPTTINSTFNFTKQRLPPLRLNWSPTLNLSLIRQRSLALGMDNRNLH